MVRNPGVNCQVVLARRPEGRPRVDDFRIVETPIPTPADGEFLVRAHYVSIDPLSRVRMRERAGYGATIPVGGVVWGRSVGEIVESRNPGFRVGEFVEGMLGWQEFAVSQGETRRAEYAAGVSKVDPAVAPISTSLGILGMPGATAFFAMTEIGKPKLGETIVVSAAAGTVGSIAAQIARIAGCRVIGIAGRQDKLQYLTDVLGLDGAISYRDRAAFPRELDRHCPDGVDVYFDNVGGWIRDEMLRRLRRFARVPLVGRIADMNNPDPVCPDPQETLMNARARMEGFIVYDYENRLAESRGRLASWIASGEMRYRETILDGFESIPRAFVGLFNGDNIGKLLVRIQAE